MIDCRKHLRLRPIKEQRFTFRFLDFSFEVEPKNISIGGLYLQIGILFPLGAVMEIELEYAGKAAKTLACVKHRHKGGVGMAFVNPSKEFRELVGVAIELVDLAAC